MSSIVARVKDKILDLHAEGYTFRAIADRLQVSKYIVRRVISENRPGGKAEYACEEDFDPLYDPARDGDLPYESVTAAILGDPPVGRRALDAKLDNTIKPPTQPKPKP